MVVNLDNSFWSSLKELSWAANFRMVDIEIKAWYFLFLNLETNLILYLYPEKCIKFNQSESRIRSWEIWNFARHPKKSGLSKKLKVSTLDIWIKKWGIKVSHSKVPSSELVDIMIKVWTSLFANIKTNLVFRLISRD